jgi:ubiquinol-cytochrome c reductase cytochrome c subunit
VKILRDRLLTARALKTAVLLAFVWTGVWVALSSSGPTASALGQEAGAAAAPAAAETAPAPAPSPDEADAVARTFLQKCAGCHTVGRGKLSGPDLNDAATWPVPELSRAIKSMEPKVGPLPDADVALLAEFLKDPRVKERIKIEEGRAARAAAASYDPPSAEIGAALFAGREPLANGGASCAACHVVNGSGGTLGPDLSGVHAKLGEAPLVSACEKSGFKIMSAAYRDHPVTRQEALHLTRFFATAAGVRAARPDPPVTAYGAAAALVGLGILAFAYRKRASGVRRRLLRRRRDGVD